MKIKYFKVLFLALIICIFVIIIFDVKNKFNINDSTSNSEMVADGFLFEFIKNVNNLKKENYLVSPYSVEIALSMLREGANNNTEKELNEIVPIRNLNISNNNVKIANAIFIKEQYKNIVEKSFVNTLETKYSSEILYDKFENPNLINNWVDNKTDGMIKRILDDISFDFVLGLANAIAIDANWDYQFKCINTKSQEFTKEDGSIINVEMMHNDYKDGIKYLDDDTKGIILPYEENLEFIGLLPSTDLQDYIDNLNLEKLDNILKSFKSVSSDEKVNLSLPRFSYQYDLVDFNKILISMGIRDAFDEIDADFSSIIAKENLPYQNIYVSTAIHKTYIDLNEKGTKAAAITYFELDNYQLASPSKYKYIEINFNKPFVYMIRDSKSKEILFFGSVYEPNIWQGSTCE